MPPENNIYGNDLVYKKPDNNCITLCGQVPARLVLYMLSWSGFLVSFMMRTDINLAIVAMVESAGAPAVENNDTGAGNMYCYDVTDVQNTTINDTEYGGTLDWSPNVQSYVLASFYWAYIISQIIGGYATQKLGTKRVFGYAQLATAVCSLCIPVASVTHYGLVIALRCVQGFASGLTWPAMYALVGHWIPTPERSRFMSSFQGFSIGIGITYPLCGFLIAHFGWRSVFYTTGSVGVVWCVAWYLLAFDSPETHPRITESEMRYIQENTVNTFATSKAQRVPWSSILRSMPAWSIGITTFGRIWVHYTFIIPGPMYMKSVLGFSIKENGVLSGAPFICSYLSSVVFCYMADKLVTRGILSLTNVRKIFTALAQVVPGLLCIVLVYSGCNVTLVLVVWFTAVTLITAAYAGAMANVVDIAPNFAGPVLAFAQTIHMTASFLSPLAAGYMTQDGHTLAAWRYVFGVTAVVACSTYIVYQIWGTGEIQKWNYPNNEFTAAEAELMIEKNQTTKASPTDTVEGSADSGTALDKRDM
ncbi:Major Facilitator Superfamily Transporter 17 [Carabus blaptoides fortunei]